ncbi:hypothetical protein F5887DRAFT_113337 [Amanita rubescens]|nr:hypothetical protein F5887DRAFT_113337 [Amanita rubescens]
MMTSNNILETHNPPLITHSAPVQVQEKPEQAHLTVSEPAPESSSSYTPPSPEQIIVVPQTMDERPIFSRHSLSNQVIFPARKPSLRNAAAPAPEQQYSTIFESLYSIFNNAYTAWTGTNEESKSPQVSSPSSSTSYSGINPSNAKSEPITITRERDRFEAWPFIGTASQYDVDNYASEDQDESFETA